MEKSLDKPDNQPSGQSEPDYWEGSQIPIVSFEELEKILADHEKWLESDGMEGKQAILSNTAIKSANLKNARLDKADFQEAYLLQADFRQASLRDANLKGANLPQVNFQGADLSNANLQSTTIYFAKFKGAILTEANLTQAFLINCNMEEMSLQKADLSQAFLLGPRLQGTDLREANLRGAKLPYANFRNADLKKANFQKADLGHVENLHTAELQDTNFNSATGLLGSEFSRADTTGATLPKDVGEFKILQVIEEISKNARKVFLAIILACVYTWLTIATTNDAHLISNSVSSPLPIIATEIPIAGFYWAAPIVLIALYFYLHFYLQRLWNGLAGLPAKFPDGKRLDERAYPWLLNGLVRRYFKLLKDDRPAIARLEEIVSIFLTWWVVPGTLLGFWLRYLPRHDWFGTTLHIVVFLISIGTGTWYLNLTRRTLRGEVPLPFQWRKTFFNFRIYLRSIILIAIGIVLFFVSLNGMTIGPTYNLGIFHLIAFTGYRPYAKLYEAEISTKPSAWTGKDEQLDLVKGVRLQGANLQYASGHYVFLVKADLRGADLSHGEFQNADFRRANLERANLTWTNLILANLTNANLFYANLQATDLCYAAGLTPESVRRANNWMLAVYDSEFAQELNLPIKPGESIWDKRWDRDFSGCDFYGAKMIGAELEGANFSKANLERVLLNDAILVNVKLKEAFMKKAYLQRSNLTGADLEGAILNEASLAFAILKGANLKGADLSGAYLGSCKGLTQEQLDDAYGNEKTSLPAGLSIKFRIDKKNELQ